VVLPVETVALSMLRTQVLIFDVIDVVPGSSTSTRLAVSDVDVKFRVRSSIREFSPIVIIVALTEVVSVMLHTCKLNPRIEQVAGITNPAARVYRPGKSHIVTSVKPYVLM
jgi:hypothetical protein